MPGTSRTRATPPRHRTRPAAGAGRDLYAQCFTAVLDDLDQPEKVLARAAIDALAAPAAGRRSRAAEEAPANER